MKKVSLMYYLRKVETPRSEGLYVCVCIRACMCVLTKGVDQDIHYIKEPTIYKVQMKYTIAICNLCKEQGKIIHLFCKEREKGPTTVSEGLTVLNIC